VLFFFTGTHNDYHKPSDTWDKINYPGETKVVRYAYRIAKEIDDQPERPPFVRVQVAQSSQTAGDGRGFSVTLGVVPDFTGKAEGMKISGIRPGGPAEKAGLKSGDTIVKMAGKKVLNIYDYMGVLGELKAGDEVEVEVLRDGKPLQVHAVMEKRK
jgi:S1-C subfamily serine protease